MSARVRILKKSQPYFTAGAYASSPAQLISGTAVPSLMLDVNTATPLDGIVVTQILASSIPAKKRHSRQSKKASESRSNFDMMPAYAAREQVEPRQAMLLRGVNTPLATKAQEEMSDFEREYPW